MAKHQATASDLAKIDKKLKGLQDHQAKAFKPLENKLVKLEKSQTETIKAIDGKIDKKVASLERKVKAAEAPHMVNAPVPDQEHMARLEKLEKSFSSKMDGDSALNKRISKITDKLASLSQKIENLNKKTTKDSELKAEETPEKARESVKETEKTVEKEKKVQADTEPKEKLTSKLEGPPPETQVDKSHRVIHKVRRGQTLFRLARKYKVSVNQIKEWNPKLHGRRYLWVGEKLVMYPGQ